MNRLKSHADYIVAAIAGVILIWAVVAGGSSGSPSGDDCGRWWGGCDAPVQVR